MSLLAFERLWGFFTDDETEPDEDSVSKSYIEVLGTVCGIKNPTEDDLNYMVSRVVDISKSDGGKKTKGSTKREFSSEFYKMVGAQSIQDLLIQMCSYDYIKATEMYTVVDRDDALYFLDVYLLRLQHDQQVMLEAAVYGAGGSFNKGSSDVDVEIDLTKGGGLDTLSKMF